MSDALDNAVWGLVGSQTAVNIDRPRCVARIVVTGDFPTDESTNHTSVPVNVALIVGDNQMFAASAAMAIQGQSSVNSRKKGYKLTLSNPTTGDDMTVKVGSWLPRQKVDLKGYNGWAGNLQDSSYVRDVVSAEIWRNIRRARPYPDNMIAPFEAWGNNSLPDTGALFSTDGFPVELWDDSGAFRGQYVFRTTNSNAEYLIDKDNPLHYLIQPQHLEASSWFAFDSTGWDISSPKMKGYSPQDDISEKFPKVFDTANRLFSWWSDLKSGTVDWDTHPQYIRLKSWIDYIIHAEVTFNRDGMVNNLMLMSWDATETSGLWDVMPYDLDETLGVIYYQASSNCEPDKIGLCVESDTGTGTPFNMLYTQFLPQIKARWVELRTANIVSDTTIIAQISAMMAHMDASSVQADWSLWGVSDQATFPYLCDWVSRRIAWLDTQWGYSA